VVRGPSKRWARKMLVEKIWQKAIELTILNKIQTNELRQRIAKPRINPVILTGDTPSHRDDNNSNKNTSDSRKSVAASKKKLETSPNVTIDEFFYKQKEYNIKREGIEPENA
jgi:hypothetical protein